MHHYHAHLVLVSKADNGEMLYADIWGPHAPWESSMQERGVIVGVYYSVSGDSFQEARDSLLWNLAYSGQFQNCRFAPVIAKFEEHVAREFEAKLETARAQTAAHRSTA